MLNTYKFCNVLIGLAAGLAPLCAHAEVTIPDFSIRIYNYSSTPTKDLGLVVHVSCGTADKTSNPPSPIGICGYESLKPLPTGTSGVYSIRRTEAIQNRGASIFDGLFVSYTYGLQISLGYGDGPSASPALDRLSENEQLKYIFLKTDKHIATYKLKGGADAAEWITKNGHLGSLFYDLTITAKAQPSCVFTHDIEYDIPDKVDQLDFSELEYRDGILLSQDQFSACGIDPNKAPLAHVSLKIYQGFEGGADRYGTTLLKDIEYDHAYTPDIFQAVGSTIELNVK